MQKACKECSSAFEVTNDDLAFYDKVSPVFGDKKYAVTPPTLCPECRRQRRFSWRNERHFFRRKSALSGQEIISMIHPEESLPVVSREEWFGDGWDAMSYGRAFDISQPFFAQYSSLQSVVPMLALNELNNENCSFTNYVASCKNCYLIFGSVYCEDCLYGSPYYSKSCIDSLLIRDCELCYDCITCEKCYNCVSCQDCVNCNDLAFCYDCQGSSACIGCTGLRNKQYYVFNQPSTKEEMEKLRQNFTQHSVLETLRQKRSERTLHSVHRSATIVQSENVTGDYIYFSKGTKQAFDVQRCDDCAYLAQTIDMKNCQDCNYTEEEELCYEYMGNYQNTRQFFCISNHNCSDVFYSAYCVSSQNLFGCIGLKHKQYCILNKQYTKEEYEVLVPKIISQMHKSSEWGEFFPVVLSPFAYNETVAQEYFPQTREEVEKKGWKWREVKDEVPNVSKMISAKQLPDSIDDIPDDILEWAIQCQVTGRPFKIAKLELKLYRQMHIPIPRLHPDERHRQRMKLRNPRKLWKRDCGKCKKEIWTAYTPDRHEKVYCEECYLKEVY